MEGRWESMDDTVLVVAIGRWQEQALAEAYRRHGGSVFGLAKRVLQDRAQAEEVVQEVFLRLWEQPERFDPSRGPLRSFLLVQAHRRSVDRLRQDTARRQRQEREARLTAQAGPNTEEDVWELSMAEKVREAFGALEHNERAAIELAYFGGHTYREVAQLLDQPEGTVKSRIRSGLKRMHRDLVAWTGEDPR
ncbi:MAG TPA: sigma-70 family RNA polymerase sigma factor [Acidimicrobiales bacterium]|nr:sigma-70 family RNA polymerase sigma factor [Acidimicrobiales bacterium]